MVSDITLVVIAIVTYAISIAGVALAFIMLCNWAAL